VPLEPVERFVRLCHAALRDFVGGAGDNTTRSLVGAVLMSPQALDAQRSGWPGHRLLA
jgi:hypothetical protein